METNNSFLTNETWLSSLLTQALVAHEEERQAISNVLGEEIGQSLTAIALYLRLAEGACSNTECSTKLQEARALVGDVMQLVEQLTRQLIPPALENQGLCSALEVYAQDFAHTVGIKVELDLEVLSSRATPDIELALFRIVQEALQNISNSESVRITMRQIEELLYLVIEDSGPGYSSEMMLSWEVLRMTQRVNVLGGSCCFDNVAEGGTRVTIRIPMATQEAK